MKSAVTAILLATTAACFSLAACSEQSIAETELGHAGTATN